MNFVFFFFVDINKVRISLCNNLHVCICCIFFTHMFCLPYNKRERKKIF